MTQWFVPPIVIPAAMVTYFVALVFIDISSVPETKATPTLKNCLPLSRSKKVTQIE